MFFDVFKVAGYEPKNLSQRNEMDMHLTDFGTLARGDKTWLNSVQKSFCMHFNVIGEGSLSEDASFSQISNPTVTDPSLFSGNILDGQDAALNQD